MARPSVRITRECLGSPDGDVNHLPGDHLRAHVLGQGKQVLVRD
jgi:hypothetical protein